MFFLTICLLFFQILFRLSPGFCFTDGLASLALRRQDMKRGTGSGVLDWNVTGASICYLLAEVLLCYSLNILSYVICQVPLINYIINQ